MRRRVLLFTVVSFAALHLSAGRSAAQDSMYVSNLAELVEQAYDGGGLHAFCMPSIPPPFIAYSMDGEPWWVDCSQLDCADLLTSPTNLPSGIQAYEVVLTKNLLTGDTSVQAVGSTDFVATVAAPSGYVPGAVSGERGAWSCWVEMSSCPDCWGLDASDLPPPDMVLKVLLADVNEYPIWSAYWSNLEAQAEAEASAASLTSGFSPMDNDGGGDGGGRGGGDPCSITNLTQPFIVTIISQSTNHATTIRWQSCQLFRYLVWEANALSTNTQWFPVAYVWGQPNTNLTTWTDTATTNTDGSAVTHRFYIVQRLLGATISAGGNHSLGVTLDGTTWAWGSNGDGELSDGTEFDRPYPGEATVPLTCSDEIVSNAVAVAAGGDEFTMIVDNSGNVWAVGDGDFGEQGNAPGNYNDVFDHYPATLVPGISNIVSVSGGTLHVLALRKDGTVWAWGSDEDAVGDPSGQLGVGGLDTYPYYADTPTQSLVTAMVVSISAGSYHSVALDANSRVWTWGDGVNGQIGDGGITNVSKPEMLMTITNVIAVSAGAYHTMALTADKTVWTWGDNTYGELGLTNVSVGYDSNGVGFYSALPGQIPPSVLSNVVAIAAGSGFSMAVTSNGLVYGWGDAGSGELATNGLTSTNSPIQVAGISNVVLISASLQQADHREGRHVVAMTVDGGTNHYWGWGDNTQGAIGNGTNSINTTDGNYQYAPAEAQFCTRCERCIQMGTGGSFTAQCNGALYLYFNADRTQFGNNGTNFYSVTFNAAGQTNLLATVMGANSSGVAISTVTNGGVYYYSASGFCQRDIQGDLADPNGEDPSTNQIVCSLANLNITNAVCPMWKCFSLVGKIQ